MCCSPMPSSQALPSPSTRKLALIGRPLTYGWRIASAMSRAAGGIRFASSTRNVSTRTGPIERLEDGRIGGIGGETLRGCHATARRRVDPPVGKPSGEASLVARQRDGFGRGAEMASAGVLETSRQLFEYARSSRGR